MDMANSFLVRARLANTSPFAPEILTYHYSADRQNAFCKETRFLRDRNSESISVCCQRLYDAPSPDSGPLRFHPQMTDVYYQGKTLSWHMLRLLSADGWTDAEFINLLLRYLHILEEYLAASSTPVLISSSDIMLPGACFDIIPQNIVVASQGDWRIIDHEWSMTREISAGYLLFRAVWTVMGMLSRFGLPNDQHVVTRFDLLVVAFQALHSFIDKEHLMAYLRQEIEMAAFVAGYEQRSDEVASWLDASLPTEHFFLQQYQQQQAAINQQSQYITTLTTRLKQLVARWSKREASIDTALASLERMQTDLPQVSSLHRSFLTKWQEFRLLRTFPETRFLFDEIWYRNRYADVGDVGTSALRHYVFHGSDKEYDPSPYFHASWYVRRYPDTASTNPLLHFIQRGAAEGRNPSPYFDTVWYRSQYSQAAGRNPFAHYLEKWREEGTSPHPCFDAVWYIGNYADVARSGGEPLSHYLTFGAKEGRNPHPLFDTAWYLWRYPRAAEYPTPLLHFLAFGKLEGLSPGPYFDSDWYVGQYRDILGDEEPFRHFLEHWRTTDCNPNPCFDCDWYRGRYPDVENSGMNPLTHYVMFGEKEGWMPCIHFDPSWYIETNPTVTPSGKGAFRHFMETGLRAWLNPNPDFDTDWFIRQYPQAADSDLPPFLYFLKKGKTENLSPRENLTIEQYYRNRHENTSMPR
ncbi:MAG: hypothetical protein LBU39_11010 [Desulfobulbaceae bacterium]|nr:hypothetical protein [Desulfobulbaceae bacterium]